MAQSNWNAFLGGVIMLFVPLYLILQIWLGFAWTGRWRVAALVPLIGFVPALAVSLSDLSRGSNLWPILVILFAPIGCIYFLAAAIARAIVKQRRAARGRRDEG